MFIEAYRQESFLKIINDADIVTPDGMPLTWALKILYGVKQPRVAGMDLLPDLLKKAEEEHLSVYFYGGAVNTLADTNEYVKKKYPELKIAGTYSPPFRVLTAEEETAIVEQINTAAPELVFVVLGCPKQEKWMAAMKNRVKAVMIGVGGALPVMIGAQKRAPKWMQQFALEWLFRLFQEPRRLFKRYAVTNSLFIWIMIKEYANLKRKSLFK
jgi:N-acetylglucosaminyldiphosphoundecaprenol N-acetyl-beta-D-mannosaminyltransferase